MLIKGFFLINVLKRLKLLAIDFTLWLFWFPIRKIIQFLPLNVTYFLASVSASCFYILAGSIRRRTYEELKMCLGNYYTEKDIRRINRRSFEMDIKRRFEELILGKFTKDTVEKMLSIEGLEHLEHALSKGKGVIILLSHFGSFLMVLPAIGFKGYKINQIGGPPMLKHHRSIHKRIFRLREREYSVLPVTFLRSDKAIKSVVNALKRNELVAIAFDGREGNSWIQVRFFDRTAYFAPGPVKLATITGATILPTFIVRQKNNTHKLVIEEPFELEHYEGKEQTIAINIQRLAKIFEGYILRYPCHFGIILSILRDRANKGIVSKPLLVQNMQEAMSSLTSERNIT